MSEGKMLLRERWVREDFAWIFWRFAWKKNHDPNTGSYFYAGCTKFTQLFLGLCFITFHNFNKEPKP